MIIKNKKNRRGWVRIIEASVAILLITSVLLIVFNRENIKEKNISSKIYEKEISILREIQLNKSLRAEILNLNAGDLPVNWSDAHFPLGVKNKIKNRTLDYLSCEANVCKINGECKLVNSVEKDTYVQSVLITVSPTQESEFFPRQLKLFCWRN